MPIIVQSTLSILTALVFSSQTNSADIIQTVPVSGATQIYQLFSGTRYKILMSASEQLAAILASVIQRQV